MENLIIIIPAYNPNAELIKILEGLVDSYNVIVVNDGSGSKCDEIFNKISNKVKIIKHDQNRGKGQAIKTGLKYYRDNFSNQLGVVLADADGQHSIEDIKKVSKKLTETSELIFGVRDISKMPLKSKVGNYFMKFIINSKYKVNIKDTQTGLRGIPDKYIDEIISLYGNRYEYETNMLEYLLKKQYLINQIKIKTIYSKDIKSKFRIFRDSTQIISVL